MLKFGSNIIRELFAGKSKRKIRTDSYWTEIYPSPEPSWLRKSVNKAGEWIYNGIDNFFQGHANKSNAEFHRDSDGFNILSAKQIEWELNQDIVDIVFKDIKSSLSWIIPGFIRKHTIRVQQFFLLYLFTDVTSEEGSSEWFDINNGNKDQLILEKTKMIYTYQGIKERIDSNCLSINIWWKKFIFSIKVFLRLEEEKNTFYLLGYFAPQGRESIINIQKHMIRGPDKSKLNPAFSFHKRI